MRPQLSPAIEGTVGRSRSEFAGSAPGLPLVGEKFLKLHLKRTTLVVALTCLIFTIAAVVSFPEADDGVLALTINELGSKGIVKAHSDYLVSAWFWRFLLDACGVYFWPMMMLLNGLLWCCVGLEAAYLWVRVFPEHHGFTPLAGCLAIAPIVVRVQTTAVTIGSTVVFAVVIGYFSLFLFLRCLERHYRGGRYGIAVILLAAAVFLGDYGLSIGLTVFALLIGIGMSNDHRGVEARYRRTAWTALAITAVTHCFYLIVLHYTSTSATIPAQHNNLLRRLEGFPFSFVSALWHVVVGAYGTFLGDFSLSWGSKTLLISLLFGILLAFVLRGSLANETTEALNSGNRVRTIFLALLSGLAPLVFNHPFWTETALPRESEAASRFFIPVMPVAACLTLSIVLRIVRARFRLLVAYVLGLLIGYSLLNQVWTGFRRQHLLSGIGTALKSYVAPGGGEVVGVLSTEDLCFADFSCTAKASSGWSSDLTKSFWLYKPSEAVRTLGTRKNCTGVTVLHAGIRAVRRIGPITNIVWVQMAGDRFTLEPYCLAGTGVTASRPSIASTVPPSGPLKGALAATLGSVSGPQDLTQLGQDDWEHWTSASTPNHKASGGKQIYYYNTIGGAAVHDDSAALISFNWGDGTPTDNATNIQSEIILAGQGHGFQIAAPADTRERILSVYVGVRRAQGKIQAQLSDGSAPDYFDATLSSAENAAAGVYKFTYKAGSAGQRLVVTFTQLSSNPQGNIALAAATLESKNSDSE
jgi:hypothetical protein